MKKIISLLVIVTALLLSGCAHPIKIEPDPNKLQSTTSVSKINTRIGYYIPPELIALEVTTPGGGGDNVRYYPYKSIEEGYGKILNNVFTHVTKLQSLPEPGSFSRINIDYLILPQMVTNSGSTGFFTWPPTNFTVDLTNDIIDSSGQKITVVRVIGTGTVNKDFDRFLDHGFVGKRAMEDALLKTQSNLLALDIFSQKTAVAKMTTGTDNSERLTELDKLLQKRLITQREYDQKRDEILKSL